MATTSGEPDETREMSKMALRSTLAPPNPLIPQFPNSPITVSFRIVALKTQKSMDERPFLQRKDAINEVLYE